jgi:hypothetical protein
MQSHLQVSSVEAFRHTLGMWLACQEILKRLLLLPCAKAIKPLAPAGICTMPCSLAAPEGIWTLHCQRGCALCGVHIAILSSLGPGVEISGGLHHPSTQRFCHANVSGTR